MRPPILPGSSAPRLVPTLPLVLALTIGSLVGCGPGGVTKYSPPHELTAAGIGKLKEKRYDEALQYFRWAAVKNHDATTWALAGDCQSAMKKYEEAESYYQRAVEIDPGHCGANHALGRTQLFLKKYDKALPSLEKAIAACSGQQSQPWNLNYLVETCLALGDATKAETYFRELQTRYPDDKPTFAAGERLARKNGDEAAAKRYRDKLDAIDKKEAEDGPGRPSKGRPSGS